MFNRTRDALIALMLGLSCLSPLWAQTFTDPPLLDNCNRTENPLVGTASQCASPPCWTNKIDSTHPNNMAAQGTYCYRPPVDATTDFGSAWWNTSMGSDMAMSAVLLDATFAVSGRHFTLYVRGQQPGGSGTFDGYACRFNAFSEAAELHRLDNGTMTVIGTICTGVILADGDSLGCRIIGSTVSIHRKTGGTWQASPLCSATDSTYTGVGYIGFGAPADELQFDDLRGQTLDAATTVTQGAILPLLQ
jgi:hypothetical protein